MLRFVFEVLEASDPRHEPAYLVTVEAPALHAAGILLLAWMGRMVPDVAVSGRFIGCTTAGAGGVKAYPYGPLDSGF